jgi:hypothetical protein
MLFRPRKHCAHIVAYSLHVLKPLKPHAWEQEDRLLVDLVNRYGTKMWSAIVPQMQGRTGKQCRERYRNQLDPQIRRGPWTEEENRAILVAQAKFGNRCDVPPRSVRDLAACLCYISTPA